jgi:hypothetical protein
LTAGIQNLSKRQVFKAGYSHFGPIVAASLQDGGANCKRLIDRRKVRL